MVGGINSFVVWCEHLKQSVEQVLLLPNLSLGLRKRPQWGGFSKEIKIGIGRNGQPPWLAIPLQPPN